MRNCSSGEATKKALISFGDRARKAMSEERLILSKDGAEGNKSTLTRLCAGENPAIPAIERE